MKSKKFVAYAQKKVVLIMMTTIKSVTKSEIIVITPEHLEEMLIVLADLR